MTFGALPAAPGPFGGECVDNPAGVLPQDRGGLSSKIRVGKIMLAKWLANEYKGGIPQLIRPRAGKLFLIGSLFRRYRPALLQKIRGLECFRDLPIAAFTNAFVPQMVENALKAAATKVFNKTSMIRSMLLEALGLGKQPATETAFRTFP